MPNSTNALPEKALDLENRAVWPNNEPTLFEAYEVLRDEWSIGRRNRETALHIAFLAWYLTVDFDTGYEEVQTEESDEQLATLFGEAHDWLDFAHSDDPEVVYVFHVICQVGTLFLGSDGRLWEDARMDHFRERLRRLLPEGIDPIRFANRGYFGKYFSGHARNDAEQGGGR